MIVPVASSVALLRTAVSEIDSRRLTDSVADVAIDGVALATVKHSVVVFVWLVGRYLEPVAGVYSARKQ